MNNNKTKIILPILAFLILLVTIIGTTFSFFASTYMQSGNNQTINISTDIPTNITYYPGSNITFNNLNLPESTKGTYVKVNEGNFSVSASSTDTEDTIFYDIEVEINTNTLTSSVGQGINGIVMCRLYGSLIENGNYTKIGGDINCDDDGYLAINETFNTIDNNNVITGDKYYKLEVYVWNHNTLDNSLSGKTYNATLKLSNVESLNYPSIDN